MTELIVMTNHDDAYSRQAAELKQKFEGLFDDLDEEEAAAAAPDELPNSTDDRIALLDQPQPPAWANRYLSPKQQETKVPLSKWEWLVRQMPKELVPMRSRALAFGLVSSCLGKPFARVGTRDLLKRMGAGSMDTVVGAVKDLESAGFVIVVPGASRTPHQYWLSWPRIDPCA